MFTCSGGSDYPTRESGKACFSKDMETNEEDGCGMVASVGLCDRVCVAGFCGVNDPPLEYRGSTNVLYVYLKEYDDDKQQSDSELVLKILIPILAFVLMTLVTLILVKKRMTKKLIVASSQADGVYGVDGKDSDDDAKTIETGVDINKVSA
jgi:hypothetical protein